MSDPFVTATDDRSRVTVFVSEDDFLARKLNGVWELDESFEAQDLYDNFAEVPSKEAAALSKEAKEFLEKQVEAEHTNMSTATGKLTRTEIAMKYGSKGAIPADDPIFDGGFQIGATRPYKQAPTGSTAKASSAAQDDPMQPAVDQIERALRAKDAQVMAEYEAQKVSRQPSRK